MGRGMRADGIQATEPAGERRCPRAVLLDALGTLVDLVPPWPALVQELAARGVTVSERRAREALLAEMAYYRAHHAEGRDAATLRRLRERCARVLGDALGPPARRLGDGELLAALLASLRFVAFPDAGEALEALRRRGARLVVVSNWDVSLHDVLARTGLAGLVDAVVTSAEAGAAKPDPALFRAALRAAGRVRAADALHVGDSLDADVAGARAAGVEAVLLRRDGGPPVAGVRTIRSLTELVAGDGGRAGPGGSAGAVSGGPAAPGPGRPAGPVSGGPAGPVSGGSAAPGRGRPAGPVSGGPPGPAA
jgi:putative hydrolase of the HAD superfamily